MYPGSTVKDVFVVCDEFSHMATMLVVIHGNVEGEIAGVLYSPKIDRITVVTRLPDNAYRQYLYFNPEPHGEPLLSRENQRTIACAVMVHAEGEKPYPTMKTRFGIMDVGTAPE